MVKKPKKDKPKTSSNVYTAADHHHAFDLWFKYRAILPVANEMEVNYATVYNWSTKKFRCRRGCPWHGWEDIVLEKERALQAKQELINKQEFDPIKHQTAMENAMSPDALLPERKIAIEEVIKSDWERVQHWEVIYAKAFYDATGIALSYDELKDKVTGKNIVWEDGLQATNFEAAVRIMSTAQNNIDALAGRLKPANPVSDQSTLGDKKTLRIDELRDLRDKMINTPKEELQEMAKAVANERP